jgi:hypothetical protein
MKPLNITLLQPTAQLTAHLKPVKVLDTFDGAGHNFHPEGLFSVEIFGGLGSQERDRTFSYVDLKVNILHPEIFNNLIKLKAMYQGILSGRTYAEWDPKEKDFVLPESGAGQTGFAFFMRHFEELCFKQTDSTERAERIRLLDKYRTSATLRRHLIMPAGLRDLQVKPNGHTTEDEINELYRKLISVTNTIGVIEDSATTNALDGARWALQRTANLIYESLKNLISGKRGFLLGKWAARSIAMGTRNVIAAMDTVTADLEAPNALEVTDTEVGFGQTMRAQLPKTIYGLKSGYLSKIITSPDQPMWLVDRKTLKPELVAVVPEVIESYLTKTGLESMINRFFQKSSRNRPISIMGRWLGLIYVDDRYFKIFNDITQLPAEFSRENVHPLTLADLLFVSTFRQYRKLSGLITRYPVTGTGSTYPTFFKVRTTVGASEKCELGPDWLPLEDGVVYNFPARSAKAIWQESLRLAPSRLSLLGADHDGDTTSSNFTLTETAHTEIENYYKKRKAYVGSDGSLLVSIAIDTVRLAVENMTGEA